VAGRLVHAALVAVVAVVLSAPVAIAQRADSNGTGHHVQAAARTVQQPDPRDPFDDGAAGGGTGSGADGGISAAPGGVTGEHTLPLTGSRAVRLVSVAVALLSAGLMALWATRYRPRHGSYRPRHAR
jgi:opacity protein-like surface antigen